MEFRVIIPSLLSREGMITLNSIPSLLDREGMKIRSIIPSLLRNEKIYFIILYFR